MLTESKALELINTKYNLPKEGIDYLISCLLLGPSRRVGTHAKNNVCSWPVSSKTGQTVSTESHTAESAFRILSDHDKYILGILDQGQPINIDRTNKNGKISKGSYTVDFIVYYPHEAKAIEVKTEEEIEAKLATPHPDWVKNEDDTIEYIPAKSAFADLGLKHEVFVYSANISYLVLNTQIMLWSRERTTEVESLDNKISKAFKKSFVWSLEELSQELALIDRTPLVQLLDNGALFANFHDELISCPAGFFVALDRRMLNESKKLRDQRRIFIGNNNEGFCLTRFPSHSSAQEALTRLDKIDNGEKGRSIRRWKELIRKGKKQGLSRFQSLISRRPFSGNRKSKIEEVVEIYLIKYLWEEFVPNKSISVYAAHADYLNEAEKVHPSYEPVSRTTFKDRFDSFPQDKVNYIRGGKRAGNAASLPSDPSKRSLKAQLAWQKVSIDHCLAKIFLIYFTPDGVPYAMRSWITCMIDMATSRVLAISVSFEPPSRHAVCKVIRECVRRHGKLPREMMVDRGAEFQSVYFSSLLAHNNITLSLRPSSHSRYGSEVEGFFGEFRKQWLTLRPGNMTQYKEARSVDGNKSPKNFAILRPYDFLRELNGFCEWRDNKCRGFAAESAIYTFKKSERDFPFLAIPIEYDHEFLIMSSIEQRNYTLDMQRGLHIGDFWYWHPKLSYYRGRKKDIEVRLDPENPHVVYARVENEWVTCSNAHINAYAAKDPISQLVDGLIYCETSSQRRKIKLEATRELTRMAREMDKVAEQGTGIPVVNLEIPEVQNSENVTSIFDSIKDEEVSTVELEYWSA